MPMRRAADADAQGLPMRRRDAQPMPMLRLCLPMRLHVSLFAFPCPQWAWFLLQECIRHQVSSVSQADIFCQLELSQRWNK